MVATLVQGAIMIFDGAIFDTRGPCPSCGGRVSGYDSRKKKFAELHDEKGGRIITVTVKRFTCPYCGTLCNGDEPFYPGTRIGSPIIDLCRAFSQADGYGRAARNLEAMGISMDRMTCRHYAMTLARPIPSLSIFGFSVPQTIVSLSSFSPIYGEGSPIPGAEALAACGFPSSYRAPPDILLAKRRDYRTEEREEEIRKSGELQDRGEG
jgi:hypothetical protein